MKKTRRKKKIHLLTFLSGIETKGQDLTSPFGNSLKKSAHIAGVPSLLQEHRYPSILTSRQAPTECPAREQIEMKQTQSWSSGTEGHSPQHRQRRLRVLNRGQM